MNYLLIIIIALVSLGVGFLFGYEKGSATIDEIVDAQEAAEGFLGEVNNLLSIEGVQASQTMEYIYLLEEVEKRNFKSAEDFLIDSVGRSYKLSEEAVDVGMASDQDIEIVKRVGDLSKNSVIFKKIMKYEE